MDLDLNEQQKILKRVARGFLEVECPTRLVKEMAQDTTGYTPELWRAIASLGWQGLIIPEKYGGSEGSFLDLVILLEEMGRVCLPGPFFSTAVIASSLVLDTGNEEQRQELLPKIADGDVILTLALTEPSAKYDAASIRVKAIPDKDDYVINGTKLFVPNAHIADYIICVAITKDQTSEGRVTLFLVDGRNSGVSCNLLQTMAGDKQCEVIFNNARVSKRDILGEIGHAQIQVEKTLQKAAIAKCAEMVGGAQRVLEMAVSWARQRVQFGHPIGSYQSIQHHFANILTDIETSRLMTYEAAWRISEGLSHTMEVMMAKAWVSDAYQRVCVLGHQVQGGVAVIEDHDMPLYSRQAKTAEVAFGDADFHRELVAQQLGL